MPLETATYITDLVTSNPAHTDGLAQADSHMRLLKSTIKATFPNFTDVALASTQAQLDAAVSVTSALTALPIAVGTAALPGLYVLGDTDTGFYQPAADQLAISLNGAGVAAFTTVGVAFSIPVAAVAFAGGTGQLVPIGSTLIWWDDVLPTEGGYVWANGVPISRTTYPVLFARWGTRFGAGDGSTTFGIPDLRDTVPVGKSTMGGAASRALQTLTNTVLGTLIGAANIVLALGNFPTLTATGVNSISVTSSPQFMYGGTNVLFGGGSVSYLTQSPLTQQVTCTGNNNITVSVGGTGPNSALNNVQPSTTCNYILRAA